MAKKYENGIRVSVKRVEFYHVDLGNTQDPSVAREMVQEMLETNEWSRLTLENDNGWNDIIMLEDIFSGEQIVEGEDNEPIAQD
jgi:hypothetical protein